MRSGWDGAAHPPPISRKDIGLVDEQGADEAAVGLPFFGRGRISHLR